MKIPFIETVLRKAIKCLMKLSWKLITDRGVKQGFKELIDVPYSDCLGEVAMRPVRHSIKCRGWVCVPKEYAEKAFPKEIKSGWWPTLVKK